MASLILLEFSLNASHKHFPKMLSLTGSASSPEELASSGHFDSTYLYSRGEEVLLPLSNSISLCSDTKEVHVLSDFMNFTLLY